MKTHMKLNFGNLLIIILVTIIATLISVSLYPKGHSVLTINFWIWIIFIFSLLLMFYGIILTINASKKTTNKNIFDSDFDKIFGKGISFFVVGFLALFFSGLFLISVPIH